jgi:integrase
MSSSVQYSPERIFTVEQTQFIRLVDDVDVARSFEPVGALSIPAAPPRLETFADADAYLANHPDWAQAARGPMRSACRAGAASVKACLAAQRNEPFDRNPKNLDLACVPFDIAVINGAWKDLSYRAAGFDSEKTFRNVRWVIRSVGRKAGMVAPHLVPPIPADDPFEPLQHNANKFERKSARLFAAWCRETGRDRDGVTDATLIEYGSYETQHMVGKRTARVLRVIARLWNATAQRDPTWPQTKLSAPSRREYYSLPFSAYPQSFQDDIAALTTWMAGTKRRRSPNRRPGRKRALRPATITGVVGALRLAAWALVASGRDPASIPGLDSLVTEAAMETILLCHEERAKARQQALPEAERVGTNALIQSIAAALVMVAQHFCEVSPERLVSLKDLAADFRGEPQGKPTRKNRRRVNALLDDQVKLKRLMRLPRTLMEEALERREQAAEILRRVSQTEGPEAIRLTHKATGLAKHAAYLAREAAVIGILCRIPLRIKNLHAIRIGTNLQFTGGGSDVVTLNFSADETKNRNDLEFYIGPRLHALLQTYIETFLPFFATASTDFNEMRWLFPSGGGRSGPVSIGVLRVIIVRTVADNVGATVNPHLFRALAVTLALQHSPDALEHCRLLLGDKSLKVVLRHYAMLQEKDAARRQSAFVDAEEDRLARIPAPPAKQRRGSRS